MFVQEILVAAASCLNAEPTEKPYHSLEIEQPCNFHVYPGPFMALAEGSHGFVGVLPQSLRPISF